MDDGAADPHKLDLLKRIGHKGADAIAPGNTAASFRAAVDVGVDVIEFDVIRNPAGRRDGGRLVLAHDPQDAAGRTDDSLLTLEQGLDLFAADEFAGVGLDVDMKHRGFELDLLDALRERELTGRTMVTTMELDSLRLLREHIDDGELPLGLTIPHVTKDWINAPAVVKPLVAAGVIEQRVRQPGRVAKLVESGLIDLVMAFHQLVTPRLASSVQAAGGELYAWTVDDVEEIKRLSSLKLAGIVSNDPRLFDAVERDEAA